ncbi:hypothetical protein Zmor_001781 [Zophobas morio]|uniref:Uncharacterized protein n=1 Tax=Zophobas morio TaxID=2755281 RepID=A0AA38IZA5_9CUCU|nr:hypothetical protein Zmor_001781 [Zophobas morio]
MGDSSSVAAAGRCSHKGKLGPGYRKSRLQHSEKPRSGIRDPSRGMYGFKYRPLSGMNSLFRQRVEYSEQIQPSCTGIIWYIIAV